MFDPAMKLSEATGLMGEARAQIETQCQGADERTLRLFIDTFTDLVRDRFGYP